MARFFSNLSNTSGDSNFLHDMVGQSVARIDRLVPPVIKDVSSEAVSAVQTVHGVVGDVAAEVHSPGLVGTSSGFFRPILSDAISTAPGVATELQHAGMDVSSEAILAAQMSPVVAPQVQHSGLLGTASGFIKQVSSDAISAAQNSPGVAGGLATDSGLLGTASGFIKQVSSDAFSAAHGVATEVQHAGMVGESLTNIDRLVPSVIKQVSSEAISAVQNVPGVATEVGNVGVVGESLAKIDYLFPSVIKQVSSDAFSATQKVAGVAAGLASDVQHGGLLSTASGLIKDVSSQAISAAQGVVTELKHAGEVKEEAQKLKYLAFVQVAIVHVVLWFTNLYANLKQKLGPLKPVVEIVERMVKSVLGPIFDKFFDALYEQLKFADDKVGEFVTKIDSLLPPVIKQVLSKVISAARNALGLTVDVPTTEVQSTGVASTASGFLKQISSGAISAAEGVASGVQHSGLIPEELQTLKYMKYLKYFATMQAAALRAAKFYFEVKEKLGPLEPVIEIIEQVVISLYQMFLAELVKSLVKWVLVKFFGVPAELFDLIDKVGDVSKLGDLSNIDALVPSGMKLVSSDAISAVQNLPGVVGLATELPGTGMLSSASGFLKQVSSGAISGAQGAPDVQHAGVVGKSESKIDSLIPPLFKRASSEATSVAQKALGVAGGGATEVLHTELTGSATGFIKQISSGAISAAQKAPGVAQGLATAGVGSTATGFIKQLSSGPISATQKSPEVQHAGVVTTASALAKTVFTMVEPKAEKYAVSVWHKLNRIPLFPQVASVVLLTAAFFTDKYNQTVATGAEKGYKIASFLPLVPTEKIAKVFDEGKSD